MGFTSVRGINFRNLNTDIVNFDAKNIFLVGENGQGKTNLLELIYYLSFGSSFRAKTEKNIVKHGEKDFSVFGNFCWSDSPFENKIKIKVVKGNKEVFFNDKKIFDRKILVNKIPCTVFCHDDMSFVMGNPERKRWFFDQTVSLIDSEYIDILRDYKKTLKERNFLIKSGKHSKDVLDIYSWQLSKLGIKLIEKRKDVVNIFNTVFLEKYKLISNLENDLEIRYEPSWKNIETVDDAYRELERKINLDKIQGSTSSGPHRDNYNYYLANNNFLLSASTGQIRLISLILRIAQSYLIKRFVKKKSILLLDDVLLELDSKKRELFMDQLPEYEQAFFTFLPDNIFLSNRLKNSETFSIKKGKIFKYEGF